MQISIYANVGRVYNNTCIFMYWANTWDFGTYRICEQRRLRRDCASAQSRQSLLCSYTWSKNQTSSNTRWLSMRIWRMHLRRTKSTIISYHGSIYFLWQYQRQQISQVSIYKHRSVIFSIFRHNTRPVPRGTAEVHLWALCCSYTTKRERRGRGMIFFHCNTNLYNHNVKYRVT